MPHSVSYNAAGLAQYRNCSFVIFENILKSIQAKRVSELLVAFFMKIAHGTLKYVTVEKIHRNVQQMDLTVKDMLKLY